MSRSRIEVAASEHDARWESRLLRDERDNAVSALRDAVVHVAVAWAVAATFALLWACAVTR